MKANETTLREILDGSRQYIVPLFQRPYSWKQPNWKLLWNDLTDLYQEDSSENAVHFFGPIVIQNVPEPPLKISAHILIDGQQRLTTLSILIAALRDCAKISYREESMVSSELHDFLTNRYGQGDSKLKILPTQIDRPAYKTVVHGTDGEFDGLIKEAYEFFCSSIKDAEKDPEMRLDIERFSTLILSGISLVNILLDKNDDPYLIYESLNYKGEPLSQADLIRNHLFMKLDSSVHDQIYADRWLPIEKRFKHNANKDYLKEMTLSFWYYLRKMGRAVNQKLIYQNLKSEVDRDTGISILGKLDDLLRFSNYYLRIHFPENEEKVPEIRNWFEHFKELKLTSYYPFLLNIFHDYESGYITLKDFVEILEILESYAVRRWICGVPSSPLNKTFIALYQQIIKNSPVVTPSGVRSKLASFDRTQRWPTDEELRQNIIERPLYGDAFDGRKRVKFVLQRIQERFSKEIIDFSNLNIEHVLPQKLTPDWRSVLGSDADVMHRQWSDVLGNLTLVVGSENSEMSNHSFAEKLKFLRNSNLAINKYFYNLKKWDHIQIQKRGEHLAEQAIVVWPR